MTHSPKHRGTHKHAHLAQKPKKALRTTMLLSTVAVAATGGAVAGGLASGGAGAVPSIGAADAAAPEVPTLDLAALAEADVVTHGGTLSRSADRREGADPAKAAALDEAAGPAATGSKDLSEADPRDIAKALLGEFGFGLDQFSCLDALYMRESRWNPTADNPHSSAYGIPQALPGSKMASAGADWATNPVTQIRWGLGYIQDRYGSPCGAWAHSQGHGWY